MTPTFTNAYVVRVTSGHPGYVDHQVIATENDLRALVRQVEDALKNPPTTRPDDGARMLASLYATEAYGQSERVYLSFHVAPDLTPYHRTTFRVRHRDALVWIPALAVLGLALVGVRTILAWLVSPGALW